MCHNAVAGGALDSRGASPCLGMFQRIMIDVRQLCESMCNIVGAVIRLLSETQTFLPLDFAKDGMPDIYIAENITRSI